MFKLLVLSAAAVFANANPSDFPALDDKHPHCQLQVTYPNRTCEEVYTGFNGVIKSFEAGDPGKGTYAFKEEEDDKYVWAVRTSADGKQVDDVLYTLNQSDKDCIVSTKSRQQQEGGYDSFVSYCSSWFILKYSAAFVSPVVSNCPFTPVDPDTDCVKYAAAAVAPLTLY